MGFRTKKLSALQPGDRIVIRDHLGVFQSMMTAISAAQHGQIRVMHAGAVVKHGVLVIESDERGGDTEVEVFE